MDFGIASILEKPPDRQFQSRFFCLAPEIRNLIYSYVFVDEAINSTNHDFRIKYNHDGGHDDDGALDAPLARSPGAMSGDSDLNNARDDQEGLGVQHDDRSLRDSGAAHAGDGHDEDSESDSYDDDDEDEDDNENEDDDDESEQGDWRDYTLNVRSRDFVESGRDPEVYRASDVIRPGCAGSSRIHISLLCTCRRAYMEAYHQIPENFVWRAWYLRAPFRTREQRERPAHPRYLQVQKQALQVHFFTQMYWLDERFYREIACPPHSFRQVEHFRLTIRSRDWQHNEYHHDLWIDPFHQRQQWDHAKLWTVIADCVDFGKVQAPESPDYDWTPPLDFGPRAWGLSFRHLRNLKSLTIDFDTNEIKKPNMDIISDWASRVWRFPLGPRTDGCTYLSAQGNPIKKMSWRGLPIHWPYVCPLCRCEWAKLKVENLNCPECVRKQALRDRDLGPRMYTWTLTWTPRIGKPWVPCYTLGDSTFELED